MMIVDNDLLSIQQARILAEDAFAAQKKLAAFSQEQLDAIVECVADAVESEAEALAVLSYEETDYGRWQDKVVKNRFVCRYVREQLRGMRCVGVIGENPEKRMLDIGVPVGVIAALCPVTSPVATTVHNTLLAIKSGNAIIFAPHPRAMKSIGRVLEVMTQAAESCGLPKGCIAALRTVTKSGTRELMNHAATSLVMVTGVPGMLQDALGAKKPVIYGGTGNGPAFIERSADIGQAVRDVIASKTFDNGIAPSAEQSLVVDSCISQEVKRALVENGAYFMSEEESHQLMALFFCPDGRRKPGTVGLPASVLAKRAGITVPGDVTVLIAERKYVSAADPYSRELLAPVLGYYTEDDWEHACEKCIELLLHERNAHTLVIHSKNEEVIRLFALKKPVGRLLVNTPAAFGGIGATTNLFPSMILGSGSAGYGITSENVSPMQLIYTRKVGYGVRRMDDSLRSGKKASLGGSMLHAGSEPDKLQALHQILIEAIGVMDGPAHT